MGRLLDAAYVLCLLIRPRDTLLFFIINYCIIKEYQLLHPLSTFYIMVYFDCDACIIYIHTLSLSLSLNPSVLNNLLEDQKKKEFPSS